ncbi:unnamed protein product, partial [Iphiclides podalirius]
MYNIRFTTTTLKRSVVNDLLHTRTDALAAHKELNCGEMYGAKGEGGEGRRGGEGSAAGTPPLRQSRVGDVAIAGNVATSERAGDVEGPPPLSHPHYKRT